MKIALCFTGQTRDYNNADVTTTRNKTINDLFVSTGAAIDFYGHTWTDCDKPHDIDKFSAFYQEDQDTMALELMANGLTWQSDRYENTDEWINSSESKRLASTAMMTKVCWAQLWSNYRVLDLIPNVNDYDVIVRLRWDIGRPEVREYHFGKEISEYDEHMFRCMISDFSGYPASVPEQESTKQYTQQTGNSDVPRIMIANTPVIKTWRRAEGISFNDVIFCYSPKSCEEMLRLSIVESFKHFVKSDAYTHGEAHYVPCTHQLWARYFEYIKATLIPFLPDIIGISNTNRPELQQYKEIYRKF